MDFFFDYGVREGAFSLRDSRGRVESIGWGLCE